MSAITFRCGNCQATLRVGAQYTGRLIRCPKCQKGVRVPSTVAPQPPLARPPQPPANVHFQPQSISTPTAPLPRKKQGGSVVGILLAFLVIGVTLASTGYWYFFLNNSSLQKVAEDTNKQDKPDSARDKQVNRQREKEPNQAEKKTPIKKIKQPNKKVEIPGDKGPKPKPNNPNPKNNNPKFTPPKIDLAKLQAMEKKLISSFNQNPDPNAFGSAVVSFSGHDNLITRVAFSPDGKWLASSSDDHTIKIWDLQNRRLAQTLPGHKDDVESVAWFPEGSRLASGGKDQTIRIWSFPQGKLLQTKELAGEVGEVVISPSGKTIAATTNVPFKSLYLWNLPEDHSWSLKGVVANNTRSLAFSPDGSLLACAQFDRKVVLRKMPTGKEIAQTIKGMAFQLIGYSPDGRFLAIGGESDQKTAELKLVDLHSGKEKNLKLDSQLIGDLEFSPDGKWLGAVCRDDSGRISLKIWEIPSGRVKGNADLFGAHMAISPGGMLLAGAYKQIDICSIPDLFDKSFLAAQQRLPKIRQWAYIHKKGKYFDITPKETASLAQLATLKDFPNIGILRLGFKFGDNALALLPEFQGVRGIRLAGGSYTGKGLAHLKKVKNLRSVNLDDLRRIRDSHVEQLQGLTELTELDLGVYGIFSSAALQKIKGLTKLRRLKIRTTKKVGKEGSGFLKNMPQMEELDIDGLLIGDAGMENLAGMTNMRILNLRDNNLTDAGMAVLKNMKQMVQLNLGGNFDITGPGLANLQGMESLQKLDLAYTGVDDDGLAYIKNLRKIKELYLLNTRVGDKGFAHLKNLHSLEQLKLGNLPELKGPGLQYLGKMPNLKFLDLSRTGVSNAGLAFVRDLKQLRELELPDQTGDAGLVPLGELENLTELNLYGMKNVKGPGLKHLAKLPYLKELNLKETGVTDQGLEFISGIRQLKVLSLPKQITDKGLSQVKSLPDLQVLNLGETKITDQGLEQIGQLKNLIRLDISRTNVTDAGLMKIKGLNSLQMLNVTSTRITEQGIQLLRRTMANLVVQK